LSPPLSDRTPIASTLQRLPGPVIFEVMETALPITVDPEILGGTPVFRGTRVPIQTLVDYILDGETLETFLRNLPTVRRDDAVRLLQHFNESLLAGAQR
jgi:uncharacterized protein (DUF433 family)